MWWRTRGSIEDAEDLVGEPWKKWGLGVALALIPIAYGIHCLLSGRALIPGRYGLAYRAAGSVAIAMAIAYIAIGAFLHFRFFWELHGKLWRFSEAGKILSLTAFLGGLGYAVLAVVGLI